MGEGILFKGKEDDSDKRDENELLMLVAKLPWVWSSTGFENGCQ